MSVELMNLNTGYICLSSDTKPTSPSFDLLYETDTGIHYAWDGSAWQVYTGPINGAQARNEFIGSLLTILGDTRLLWLPDGTDTTTSTDQSLNGRTLTYDASIATKLSRQGKGYKVDFDGTATVASTPDAANLSFGNASADSAFSIGFLGSHANLAVNQTLFAKYTGTNREWRFFLDSTEDLVLELYDESVDQATQRQSNATLAPGTLMLYGATYTAATGGSTAGNDITLYQNGLAIASTATNNGSYVAMEDTLAIVSIGALSTLTQQLLDGDGMLAFVCQKSLTASDWWAIRQLCNGYFGFLA